MQLVFKTLTNEVFTFEVDPNETVGQIKEILSSKIGIPPKDINIAVAGAILNNDDEVVGRTKLSKELAIILPIYPKRNLTGPAVLAMNSFSSHTPPLILINALQEIAEYLAVDKPIISADIIAITNQLYFSLQ